MRGCCILYEMKYFLFFIHKTNDKQKQTKSLIDSSYTKEKNSTLHRASALSNESERTAIKQITKK